MMCIEKFINSLRNKGKTNTIKMTKTGIYGVVQEDDPRLVECKLLLFDVYENSINKLFNSLDRCLFQNIYLKEAIDALPQWVIDLGRTPELNWTKDIYDWRKQLAPNSTINKFIYYYDLWNIISAIQDRLQAVESLFDRFYDRMPSTAHYQDFQYESGRRVSGQEETSIHNTLNLLFVSLASVFDLLTKIAFEQHHLSEYNFDNYKELKYKDKIFNDTGHPDISPDLMAGGMLFSPSKDVTTIIEYRNRFVHNGAWDLRNSIYQCRVGGSIVDVILYSPDLNENGRFITSGSRTCFYSQQNRMNIQLPDLVISVVTILKATIEKIADLYLANVNTAPSKVETDKCLADIKAHYDEYEKEELKDFEKRKKTLIEKYGDKEGLLLAKRTIWPGATEEQCLDAFGEPYENRKTGESTKTLFYGGGQYINLKDGKVIFVK